MFDDFGLKLHTIAYRSSHGATMYNTTLSTTRQSHVTFSATWASFGPYSALSSSLASCAGDSSSSVGISAGEASSYSGERGKSGSSCVPSFCLNVLRRRFRTASRLFGRVQRWAAICRLVIKALLLYNCSICRNTPFILKNKRL